MRDVPGSIHSGSYRRARLPRHAASLWAGAIRGFTILKAGSGMARERLLLERTFLHKTAADPKQGPQPCVWAGVSSQMDRQRQQLEAAGDKSSRVELCL